MLDEYKAKTNLLVGLGLVLKAAGMWATYTPSTATLGLFLQLTGVVLFIMGCRAYAQGKGHSPAWGWIGLLSCIGLVVLVLLPDRHKQESGGAS